MWREDRIMFILRILAGLALAPAVLLAALEGSSPLRATPLMAWAEALTAVAHAAPARAQVAVQFDRAGRIASTALVRSSGSGAADQAARDAALQLASLEPAETAAGRTRVFNIALAARP
jgi:hypothetical protein